MMPETDGRKFLRLARNDKVVRDIPLIFFSAGTALPEIQKAIVSAADGFLKKPFTEEDLLKTIRKFLSKN